MGWSKLDDGFIENPKVAAAGTLGAVLQVAAFNYCSRNLTDGFVPDARVPCLLNLDGLTREIEKHLDPTSVQAAINAMRSFLEISVRNPENFRADSERTFSDDVLGQALRAALWSLRVSIESVSHKLCESGLWCRDEAKCGWYVHDYLEHNASREKVQSKRDFDRGRKGRTKANPAGTEKPFHEISVRNPENFRSDSEKIPRGIRVPDTDTDPDINQLTTFVGSAPAVAPVPKPTGRKSRSTPPPDADREQDFAAKWGIDSQHVEFARFLDYHRAKGTLFSNWSAAWRNWLRNTEKYSANRPKKAVSTKQTGAQDMPWFKQLRSALGEDDDADSRAGDGPRNSF